MYSENDRSVKQQFQLGQLSLLLQRHTACDSEMVVNNEGTSSGLERDALRKELQMSDAEHGTEKGTMISETDSKLVPMDEGMSKKNEPVLGEGEQKMKDEAKDERMAQDALVAREGDNVETMKRADLEDKDKDVQEGGVHSKVDAEQGEKQKKLEKSSKNFDKGEEGTTDKEEKSEKQEKKGKKEEKKVEKGKEKEKKEEKEKKDRKEEKGKEKEETQEEKEKEEKKEEKEKKKEKKDKKSKSSSERILKKLEKINAKIGRILAKKEEYELRLKEAQERERQESEKAAGREASTAVVGKSRKDNNGPGLRSEENVVTDQSGMIHDAIAKESNNKLPEKGLSGSLSRTESLIEATPAELMEEVASEKKAVEKLAKLAVSDGSEVNPPLSMEGSNFVTTGQAEVLKHTLQWNPLPEVAQVLANFSLSEVSCGMFRTL
ncbi:unnamed protein product [Calypogeia fissa]